MWTYSCRAWKTVDFQPVLLLQIISKVIVQIWRITSVTPHETQIIIRSGVYIPRYRRRVQWREKENIQDHEQWREKHFWKNLQELVKE